MNLNLETTADRLPPGRAGLAPRAWIAGVALLIGLPWLNPFSPGPSPAAAPLLFSWVCAALVLLVLALDRSRTPARHRVDAVTLAWLAAAALSALIGLFQYMGAGARFGVWVNPTGLGEAFGNLRQRNQFATLMAIGFAAALWWAARWQARGATTVLVLLAVLLGAGNAASSSRTGLLQWLLLAGLTLGWQHARRSPPAGTVRRVSVVLLSGVLAYVVAMLALPWLAGLDPSNSGAWARLRAGDSVCGSRLTLWGNVLHLIRLKPWFGWGWGELGYAHFITLYPGARFCDILDNAHNLPLHLAVTLGLPVAALVCGTGLWLTWRARPWRDTDATRQLAWAVLAVILLHNLLEYPLWYGPFQTAAALSLGLLYWTPRAGTRSVPRPPARPWLRHTLVGLALVLVAFCTVAAWNYRIASQIYLPVQARAAAYRDQTLEKSQGLWLYSDQVRFAELTTLELTPDNAARVHALALDLLHFSPESRVVALLIDSAMLLGKKDEVAFYAARYRAAFPADYARWRNGLRP